MRRKHAGRKDLGQAGRERDSMHGWAGRMHGCRSSRCPALSPCRQRMVPICIAALTIFGDLALWPIPYLVQDSMVRFHGPCWEALMRRRTRLGGFHVLAASRAWALSSLDISSGLLPSTSMMAWILSTSVMSHLCWLTASPLNEDRRPPLASGPEMLAGSLSEWFTNPL